MESTGKNVTLAIGKAPVDTGEEEITHDDGS